MELEEVLQLWLVWVQGLHLLGTIVLVAGILTDLQRLLLINVWLHYYCYYLCHEIFHLISPTHWILHMALIMVLLNLTYYTWHDSSNVTYKDLAWSNYSSWILHNILQCYKCNYHLKSHTVFCYTDHFRCKWQVILINTCSALARSINQMILKL